MKKISAIALSFCLLATFASCEEEEEENKITGVDNLFGDYSMTDIHWSGLAVDINRDKIGRWELIDEFKKQFGYYEPSYIAHIEQEESEYSNDKEVKFNFVVPYPHYYISSEGEWICSCIKELKMTLRTSSKYVDQNTLSAIQNFKIQEDIDNDDPFLANITEMGAMVIDFEKRIFKVRIHCKLPHYSGEQQELSESYLYYTFVGDKK